MTFLMMTRIGTSDPMRQAFPGMSRETWLVETLRGRGKRAQPDNLVVRVDPDAAFFEQAPDRSVGEDHSVILRAEAPPLVCDNPSRSRHRPAF